MSLHHSVFEEGKAAALVGLADERNPYRAAVRERGTMDFAPPPILGGPLPSVFSEYARDWASGWASVPPADRGTLG